MLISPSLHPKLIITYFENKFSKWKIVSYYFNWHYFNMGALYIKVICIHLDMIKQFKSICHRNLVSLDPNNLVYKDWCYAMLCYAKSLQSCPTLCDPINGSPPGTPVPGIIQARTRGWVAISFSNAWRWKVKVKSLSRVRLLATPWTAAYQAPLSMGFSRQEYWSRVPLPSPLTP